MAISSENAKFQAFNDNPKYEYGWHSSDSNETKFIGIKLASPKISNFITFTSYGSGWWKISPIEFRIEGSNNGNSFISLSTQSTSFYHKHQKRTFNFDNNQPFLLYRIVCLKNSDMTNDGNWSSLKHLNFGYMK